MSQNDNALLRALARRSFTGLASKTLLTTTFNESRNYWGRRFESWAQPLSKTEEQKCQNAEKMIRNALDGHEELGNLDIHVFAQGSYRANTNVRADSDVDICVRCSNTYFYELPPGVPDVSMTFVPATLSYPTYRLKIEKALYDAFTKSGVTSGNKAFTVTENTYRITADVVPTFEFRKYFWDNLNIKYITGVCFFSKEGKFIVNWPDFTHTNGIAKNTRTGRRYKRVVRILKGLRNEMEEKSYASAKKISSFQISCLAYNVMDNFYGKDDLYDDVKGVVGSIWYNTYNAFRSWDWKEVDEIKLLFPSDQPGKAKEVADFFWDLMEYADLER